MFCLELLAQHRNPFVRVPVLVTPLLITIISRCHLLSLLIQNRYSSDPPQTQAYLLRGNLPTIIRN
jgi:hypothetical protein